MMAKGKRVVRRDDGIETQPPPSAHSIRLTRHPLQRLQVSPFHEYLLESFRFKVLLGLLSILLGFVRADLHPVKAIGTARGGRDDQSSEPFGFDVVQLLFSFLLL